MPGKRALIEQIGDRGLLLPELIARGLAANDRVKYYLTLLQAAQAHAQTAQQPFSNLREQREASGVPDPSLDHVVEASASRGASVSSIPGASVILAQVFDEVRRMLTALQAAGATRPDVRERASLYQHRLDDLAATVPSVPDDQIATGTINALTSLSRNGHDTVHQLIMDLHGELTALQSGIAAEIVDGAGTYGLTDRDRTLVRAFMAGVHQTAGLKFDHPGLGTTAARDGAVLAIQNDVGLTDAHIVVVHVEDLAVTVTCTDVHHSRLRFFQDLLKPYGVSWTEPPVTGGAAYEMTVGIYTADTLEHLQQFLTHLGSRLVFLIDWNRARKRLGRLVSKATAADILKWAADNDFGHRAFLQIGGARVIEAAFERAVPQQTHLGARLEDILGEQPARLFLMSVLRTASAGLSAGQSQYLIEDKIEAELLRYLETPNHHLLAGVAEHATMIAALAERIRPQVLTGPSDGPDDAIARTPEVVRAWTGRAEEVLRHELRLVERAGAEPSLQPLLTEASAAAAALEDAAFMLPLVPDGIDHATLELLDSLAEQVGATAREYVRCLAEGQDLSRSSDRRDVDSFLLAVDRLAALGRQAHASRRDVTERLVRGQSDCHALYVLTSLVHDFERAATALARCGAMVRDEVLRAALAR